MLVAIAKDALSSPFVGANGVAPMELDSSYEIECFKHFT